MYVRFEQRADQFSICITKLGSVLGLEFFVFLKVGVPIVMQKIEFSFSNTTADLKVLKPCPAESLNAALSEKELNPTTLGATVNLVLSPVSDTLLTLLTVISCG